MTHVDEELPNNVLKAILSVTGAGPVGLHEPSFGINEIEYLKECISSTYVSYLGSFVDKFAQELEKITQAKFVVPTVNGTSALHLALLCGGVVPGDEVLLPALTFIATANAIKYCGAEPHLVDSEANSLGVDVLKLRDYLNKNTKKVSGVCINKNTGKVIRAIVPVHIFGHPGNMDELIQLANDFSLCLIEDAAESLGSYYKGQHTGTFGRIGSLSFNGNKVITTGGGGAVITNDKKLAEMATHLSTTAKVPHKWAFIHDLVGFNYRMPNVNAAIGCAQLENLPDKLMKKRVLYEKYVEAFSSVIGVSVFKEPINCESNYWLQSIMLDQNEIGLRNNILEVTNRAGISTRPVWELIKFQQPYVESQSMNLEQSIKIGNRLINIPSSPQLVDN